MRALAPTVRRHASTAIIALLLGAVTTHAWGAGGYVGDLQFSELPADPASTNFSNSGGYVNNTTLDANVVSNTGTITNSATGRWNGDIEIGANTQTGTVSNAGAWTGAWNNAGGTLDNSGSVSGGVTNPSGIFTNEGVVGGQLTNAASATNSGTIEGGVVNSGDFVNNTVGAIVGGLTNTGLATNNGDISGGVNQSGAFTNNTGATVEGGLANSGGTSVNNGQISGGADIAAGALTNNGKVSGAVALSGAGAGLVNNGSIDGAVDNHAATATFVNNAAGVVTGAVTNQGILTNSGVISGGVANSNAFTNDSTGQVAHGLSNAAGTATNNGAIMGGAGVSGGSFVNNGTVSGSTAIGIAAAVTNNGALLGAVANAGSFTNNGAGVASGLLTNSGKTVSNGALQGGVQNSGSFTNNAGAIVTGGLANNAGQTSNAGAIEGGAVVTGGTLINSGTITGGLNNSATVISTGTISGAIVDMGTLIVGSSSSVTGEKLTILPGSSLTGALDLPVDLATGKSNFISAKGAYLGGASVNLIGNLTNPHNVFWGAFTYSDAPIPLSASSAAELAAASTPLYAYTDPTGEGITQTINPGLAATAVTHASTILTAMNTGFFGNPIDFLRAPVDPTPNLVAGGVWSRGGGGDMVVGESSSSGAITSFNRASFDAHIGGAQFGADAGLFNIQNSGMSLHFGVTGGEVFASTSDRDLAGATGVTQAPFVGLYTALAGNGFFSLFQARYAKLDMTLTDTPLNVVNQQQGASGMTYSGEAGYHLATTGGRFFVEPSAGLYLSRFQVGSEATNVGLLSFGELQSELGRLTLRVGTNFMVDRAEFAPYLAGSLWREWQGGTTISIPNGPTISQAGIGGFEQASLGVTSSISPFGLSAYAQADYRIGAEVRGWGLTGGLRYSF